MKLTTWYVSIHVCFVFSFVYDVAEYISQFWDVWALMLYSVFCGTTVVAFTAYHISKVYKCINVRDMLYQSLRRRYICFIRVMLTFARYCCWIFNRANSKINIIVICLVTAYWCMLINASVYHVLEFRIYRIIYISSLCCLHFTTLTCKIYHITYRPFVLELPNLMSKHFRSHCYAISSFSI